MINPAEGGDFHLAKTGDLSLAVDNQIGQCGRVPSGDQPQIMSLSFDAPVLVNPGPIREVIYVTP